MFQVENWRQSWCSTGKSSFRRAVRAELSLQCGLLNLLVLLLRLLCATPQFQPLCKCSKCMGSSTSFGLKT